MKTSDSIKELSTALVKAQADIKHATKDANNPHFRNDYATLESVINASKDALQKNGLVAIQAIDGMSLVTRLQHSSGEYLETTMTLVLTKQDMQGLGSAITYARRYSLAALLNMAQADDDGNEASKPAKKSKDTKPKPQISVTTSDNNDF